MHHPHAFQSKNIRDLVRIGEHRGGAVGDDRAGEFGGRQHARLDMHVPVAKARDHIAPARLDHLRAGADACTGLWDDASDPTRCHDDVITCEAFAGMHVDPDPLPEHQVGRFAPGGHGDEACGHIGPAWDRGD